MAKGEGEPIDRKGPKKNGRVKYNLAEIKKEDCCQEVYRELKDVQATVRATNREVMRIKKFLERMTNGGIP